MINDQANKIIMSQKQAKTSILKGSPWSYEKERQGLRKSFQTYDNLKYSMVWLLLIAKTNTNYSGDKSQDHALG